MKKIFIFSVCITLFIFAAGNLFGQTPQELRVGSTASGSLRVGGQSWYRVRATTTGILVVEVSSSFDSYLTVYDEHENYIAADDDSAGDMDARITMLATAGSVYDFAVSSYGGNYGGQFTVSANNRTATELRVGSSISGNLSVGGDNWYSIRPAETGIIVVETTGNYELNLTAYDEYFNYFSDGLSRVELMVSAGQTYYIKLYDYYSHASGSFRISASSMAIPQLRLGTSQSVNLMGYNVWYSIRSPEASIITIETLGDADTYLYLYDANFNYVQYDDDSGESYNAQFSFFSEANQTYYVLLNSSYYGSSRILASSTPVPADERNTERTRAVPLRLGEPIPVILRAEGESRWYSYTLTRTATLTIQTSGGLDTYLYLHDSRGNEIASNDDAPYDLGLNLATNAYISLSLNAGTYYIRVAGFGGRSGITNLHAAIR